LSGPSLFADWGTTARRAWLVGRNGETLRSIEDDRGMTALGPEDWSAAFEQLKQGLGSPEPERSLLAGMVGSRQGWRETPYLRCPVGIDRLAAALVRIDAEAAIVPGVSFVAGDTADVMRGEETQVLGAVAAGLAPPDCLACLPGTHTKWVVVRGGLIVTFRTVMTGELFAAIGALATLAPLLGEPASEGADFTAGLDRGLAGDPLTAELFAVRAHALLGTGRIGNGAAYLSGLLIGADLRAGLGLADDAIVEVIGRSDLAGLYRSAIERMGRAARTIDGASAALAGLKRIAELAP